MINFDSLANDISSQYELIPAGRYVCKIEKAEMRQPKDTSKPAYLAITWSVEGQVSKLFDNFFESDKELAQYKLRTFVEAIGLKLKTFELKDLTKVTVGKSAKVSIKINDTTEPNRNEVNVFDKPPYLAVKTTKATVKEEPLDVVEEETEEDY